MKFTLLCSLLDQLGSGPIQEGKFLWAVKEFFKSGPQNTHLFHSKTFFCQPDQKKKKTYFCQRIVA